MPQKKPSTSDASAAKAKHQLNQEDITRLLNPELGNEARMDVTGKLAYQYESTEITADQRQLVEQIFRLLVRDTELDIRKKLSDHLKASKHIPRDIALTMANDVVDVALPVLEYSVVLSDSDFIEIIQSNSDASRHVAIAKRDGLPEILVDTLLDHSQESIVASTITQNHSADVSQQALEIMIQRHKDEPGFMDSMASRPNLSPTLKEKIISKVSEGLSSMMSKQYQTASDVVEKEATQSREQATLDLINDNLNEEDMRRLVDQMLSFGRLTPSLLLAAIAHGYINFYVAAMAIMAGIPVQNAHKLMKDHSGLGFRGLYNKAKLSHEHFGLLRDVTPFAIELKDDKPGLENDGFGNLLVKRIAVAFTEQEKPYKHIEKVISASLADH